MGVHRATDTPATLREALPVFGRAGSARVLGAALVVALAARLARGGASLSDALAVGVVLAVWPLLEWVLHVFVLHARPRQVAGRSWDFQVPREHRAHHLDPWNPRWVFIPLPAFLYSLPLAAGLCFALAPAPGPALSALCAVLAAALHYELVHFLIHTRVRPRTRYYRALWQHHRRHHFRDAERWFGVTRLEADRLLGTR